MPKYKLTYFNVRGRGEIIRLALTVAGQEFEDNRFEHNEWPEIKKDFGGKDAYEQYLVDRVLGAVEDLYMKARQLILVEQDETKKVTLADLAVHDVLTTFLQRNDKLLEGYPELMVNRNTVEALPKLSAYLATRPKSDL
ncbi:hypothetical protein FSP39_001657 [Pinctada imbricata]|uniref:Uncharacterized protein n=1 Tax=Pinctada imbricata TaxID=66713 RepID=A0AA89C642_PINIB|nr:hypothetical protein FSP39_001657 [Pinctada imbricata]